MKSCKLYCIKMDLDEFNLMGLHVPVKQDQSFIYIPYFLTYKTHFFHLKICLKNGMHPICWCILHAEKYGEF